MEGVDFVNADLGVGFVGFVDVFEQEKGFAGICQGGFLIVAGQRQFGFGVKEFCQYLKVAVGVVVFIQQIVCKLAFGEGPEEGGVLLQHVIVDLAEVL